MIVINFIFENLFQIKFFNLLDGCFYQSHVTDIHRLAY